MGLGRGGATAGTAVSTRGLSRVDWLSPAYCPPIEPMVAAERGPNSITGIVFGIAAGPVTGGKATDPGSDGCAGDAGSCSSEFVPAPDWPGPLVPLPGIAVVVGLLIPAGVTNGSLILPPRTAVSPAPRVKTLKMLAAAICRYGRFFRSRATRC